MTRRVVLDTNVVVSALRSSRGASYWLLSRIDTGLFRAILSVPLVFEYEAVCKRYSRTIGLTHTDIDDILDYICTVGEHREIHFLWRPFLRDPGDDLVLEVAVESECDYIVTHNTKDFAGSDQFGVQVVTPQALMRIVGIES